MKAISTIRKFVEHFFEGKNVSFDVTPTSELRYGDLTTNAAMAAFSTYKDSYSSPRALAEEIVLYLEKDESLQGIFSKIEVAGPGFVNFWYSKEYLLSQLEAVKDSENVVGVEKSYSGEKVLVEFTDPNPFKEFHIGHLYSNIVGESISRLLEVNGAEVKRVNYQGDVGMHVAKALWGMLEKLKALGDVDQEFKKLFEKELDLRIKFLGEAYALGANAYEESNAKKQEITELNKRIFEKDPSIMTFYETGREWSLEYFDEIYKRLGTEFWKFYFESEVGVRGKRLVEEYLKKGVFEESEGAIIFPGEKYELHNRVFINSLGLPTYEAKELGLAPAKHEDYPYDLSVIVTGNEINEYFRVLLKALEQIYPELAAKTKHISHGMVRLPSGKMSSRTGDVVTGESMLEEAREKSWYKIQEVSQFRVEGKYVYHSKDSRMKYAQSFDVAEKVGIGAVKYALLKQSIGHDVVFDFDEVVSFEGNSGPYLQYTYVRIHSILEKVAKSEKGKINTGAVELNEEESELLRYLMLFPVVVNQAGHTHSPNLVCTYIYDLSQKFNTFYQKHKIIGGEQENFRLALCEGVGNALKQGLYLLGIETVEKM